MSAPKQFSKFAATVTTSDPRVDQNMRLLVQEHAKTQGRLAALEKMPATQSQAAVPPTVITKAPLSSGIHGVSLKIGVAPSQPSTPLAVDMTSEALTFTPAAAVADSAAVLATLTTQFNALLASLRAGSIIKT